MVETYRDNPLVICEDAINATFRLLSGNPEQDYETFFNKLFHTGISDILHPEFDCLRLGISGWGIDIPDEDKKTFGLKINEITPDGPEDLKNEGWDYFLGVGLTRALVSNSFVEQSVFDGKTLPRINTDIIDSPPFNRSDINSVRAHEEGVSILVVEDLESQMGNENPLLYQKMLSYKDETTDLFTARTIELYKEQPEGFLELYQSPIRNAWEKQLRETILRTYAWFTPNQPDLVPILIKNS